MLGEEASATPIPSDVAHLLRQYRPQISRRIEDAVRERLASAAGPLTPGEIASCVSRAFDAIQGGIEKEPQADPATVRQALADFDAGRWQPIQDVIDAL